MKKTLAAFALMMTIAGNAMAIDVVMLVPKLINTMTGGPTGGQYYFSYTSDAGRNVRGAPLNAIYRILLVPFAILDQETQTLTVNAADLSQLDYSLQEIAEYSNDLDKLSKLTATTSFSSKEEVKNALDSLELGTIAKEQLRLK
jgi:hypothetical protein